MGTTVRLDRSLPVAEVLGEFELAPGVRFAQNGYLFDGEGNMLYDTVDSRRNAVAEQEAVVEEEPAVVEEKPVVKPKATKPALPGQE